MNRSVTVVDLITEYRSGHFVPLTLAVERAVRYDGADYVAITDTHCPGTPEAEHWLRVLPPLRQQADAPGRSLTSLSNRMRDVGSFGRILGKHLAEAARRSDRVVLHLDWYTTPQLIGAAAALIGVKCSGLRSGGLSEIRVWMHFHDATTTFRQRKVIDLLRAFRIPTRYSSYSPAIAEKGIDGRSVVVLPLPVNATIGKIIADGDLGERRAKAATNDKLVCLLAGQVFADKGYEALTAYLARANSSGGGSAIRLRVPEGLELPATGARLEIEKMPSGQRPEESYVDTYLESDVVLMPYLPSRYGRAVSGVFIDAVVLGCLPIVSKKTTMARELEAFGLSELAVDWERDFSWDLVLRLAQDPGVTQRLQEIGKAYRNRHGLPSFAASVSSVTREP